MSGREKGTKLCSARGKGQIDVKHKWDIVVDEIRWIILPVVLRLD